MRTIEIALQEESIRNSGILILAFTLAEGLLHFYNKNTLNSSIPLLLLEQYARKIKVFTKLLTCVITVQYIFMYCGTSSGKRYLQK